MNPNLRLQKIKAYLAIYFEKAITGFIFIAFQN